MNSGAQLHQVYPPRLSPSRSSSGGFTLIDVLMAVVVMIVTLGFASMSMGASAAQSEAARETAAAHHAAETMLAELEKRDFHRVFADFNSAVSDDGADSPGCHFDVEPLNPRSNDADGQVGRIRFPTLDGAPAILREDINNAGFGLPRDLDLDGVIDAADKSASYRLLPVRIEVEWRGQRGRSKVTLDGMLSAW